jgi:glutaconate CoA-transferase, subunit B
VGLRGGGPKALVTEKGIYRFRPDTKKMFLVEISAQSNREEVMEVTGWGLKLRMM